MSETGCCPNPRSTGQTQTLTTDGTHSHLDLVFVKACAPHITPKRNILNRNAKHDNGTQGAGRESFPVTQHQQQQQQQNPTGSQAGRPFLTELQSPRRHNTRHDHSHMALDGSLYCAAPEPREDDFLERLANGKGKKEGGRGGGGGGGGRSGTFQSACDSLKARERTRAIKERPGVGRVVWVGRGGGGEAGVPVEPGPGSAGASAGGQQRGRGLPAGAWREAGPCREYLRNDDKMCSRERFSTG